MKRFLSIALTVAIAFFAMTSCQTDETESFIEASFTTDKDAYEMGEYVQITNTSSASGVNIAVYKWDLAGTTSYEQNPEDIRFSSEGSYTISLTITSDVGSLQSSFSKTITVSDNSIPPVADFSYSPEDVVAGEPIQFTDLSTDEDGTIESWLWTFGTSTSTEQNPEYTFGQAGETTVSLTVTDNNLATNTKTITIDVESGSHEITLNWSHSYEDTSGAYVKYTSPAVSPSEEYIYVTSSGYNLVCFNKDGDQKWSYKMGTNPSAWTNATDDTPSNISSATPCPSVDTDGTVYAAAGFKENQSVGGQSVIVAVYEGDTAIEKWSTELSGNSSLRYFAPVIADDKIMFSDRSGDSKHFHILSKSDGKEAYEGHCNGGSYGGIISLKNGITIVGTGGQYGSRIFYEAAKFDCSSLYNFGSSNAQAEGFPYYFNLLATSDNEGNLGVITENGSTSKENPRGSSMAADANQKVYILYGNTGGYFGSDTIFGNAVVFCYDTNKFADIMTSQATPEWGLVLMGGATNQSGVGVVVGEDGTIYAATHTHDGNGWGSRISAISSTGSLKWQYTVEGNVKSSPAIDNEGCIFYNDQSLGKIVKLSSDGQKLAELALGDDLFSSPTIASDGTIYVNGMKDDKPTIFSLSASSTDGHADSWSQMGGSPQKTFYKY